MYRPYDRNQPNTLVDCIHNKSNCYYVNVRYLIIAGSTYGTLFKISTWGESHGKGIGVVIDGCPAGVSLSESDIQPFLD